MSPTSLAAMSPTSLAAISGPRPGFGQQLRRDLPDEHGDLALERVISAASLTIDRAPASSSLLRATSSSAKRSETSASAGSVCASDHGQLRARAGGSERLGGGPDED